MQHRVCNIVESSQGGGLVKLLGIFTLQCNQVYSVSTWIHISLAPFKPHQGKNVLVTNMSENECSVSHHTKMGCYRAALIKSASLQSLTIAAKQAS